MYRREDVRVPQSRSQAVRGQKDPNCNYDENRSQPSEKRGCLDWSVSRARVYGRYGSMRRQFGLRPP